MDNDAAKVVKFLPRWSVADQIKAAWMWINENEGFGQGRIPSERISRMTSYQPEFQNSKVLSGG